jgi:hypothetical protein
MISILACGCDGKPVWGVISSSFHTRSGPQFIPRIITIREREIMFGVQPAMVGATESGNRSDYDHRILREAVFDGIRYRPRHATALDAHQLNDR